MCYAAPYTIYNEKQAFCREREAFFVVLLPVEKNLENLSGSCIDLCNFFHYLGIGGGESYDYNPQREIEYPG